MFTRRIFGILCFIALCGGLAFAFRKEWQPQLFSKALPWAIERSFEQQYGDAFYCRKIEGSKVAKGVIRISMVDIVWKTPSVKAILPYLAVDLDMTEIGGKELLSLFTGSSRFDVQSALFLGGCLKVDIGSGRFILPKEGSAVAEAEYTFNSASLSFPSLYTNGAKGETPFTLFHQKEPLVEGIWRREGGEISCQLKGEGVSFEPLARLVDLFVPFLNKEAPLSGLMTFQTKVAFRIDPKKKEVEVARASTKCAGSQISFQGNALPLALKKANLKAELSIDEKFPGSNFLKKIKGECFLDQAEIHFGEALGLSHATVQGFFDPSKPPQLTVTGLLQGEKDPLALKLETQGQWHEEGVYSLKSDMSFKNRQGVTCSAKVSFSSMDEGTFVAEIEASHLFAAQAEMCKSWMAKYFPELHRWEIQQGECEGSCSISFEKGALAQIEVRQMGGKGLVLFHQPSKDLLQIKTLSGKGHFGEEGEWFFTAELPLSSFAGLFSKDIEQSYLQQAFASKKQKEELVIELSAEAKVRGQRGKSWIETVGSLRSASLGETIQFGFKSKSWTLADLKELEEGWAHSEHLTSSLYGPLLRLISSDFTLLGTLDLIATYGKQHIDVEAKAERFFASIAGYELKSDSIGELGKTKGRIKAAFDLKENTASMTIPLSGAIIRDKERDVYLTKAKADMHISFKKREIALEADLFEGALFCGKTPLLEHLQGHVLYDKKGAVLQKAKGEMILPSSSVIAVDIASLSHEGGDLYFSQDKESLAHLHISPFASTKNSGLLQYSGVLSLHSFLASPLVQAIFDPSKAVFTVDNSSCPVSITYPVKGQWDLKNGNFAIEALSEGGELKVKKEKEALSFEQWKKEERISHLLLRSQERGFAISHFEWKPHTTSFPPFSLLGTGSGMWVDLSTEKGEKSGPLWTIQGEMNIHLLVSDFHWKGTKPVRWALDSSLGLVVGNLEMTSGKSSCQVEYLEALFGPRRLNIHKAKAVFAKEEVDLAIQAHLLPSWFEEVAPLREISVEAHGEMHGGTTKWVGALDHKVSLRHEIREIGKEEKKNSADELFFEWVQDAKSASLSLREAGEQEGLLFHFGFDDEKRRCLQSVKGLLGEMSIHLKRQGSEGFKGSVDLDFQKVSELFDLPINSILDPWKLGKGYRLEGMFFKQKRLKDLGFKGKLTGAHCECSGHILRALEAKIDLSKGQLLVENFDLSDELGKVWMSEAVVELEPKTKEWFFRIPLIEMRGVSPALFERKGVAEREVGPFVLKTVEVRQLQGKLNDLSSMTGYGNLQFANKGVRSIAIREELLRQFGANERFFIPATGKAQYAIANRRCYLREIKEVYSEQKKIEFIGPKEAQVGYIDFEGNLRFDMQLRPMGRTSVKKGEIPSMWLHVGGTWKEPELSTTTRR